MRISRTVSFGMGAVMALVIGSGTAVAATGGKFILGRSNKATTVTKLTNTRGTALQLTSRAGTPSLTVSNPAKVPNLNADRIDGLDSSAFALAAGQVNTISATGQLIDGDNDGTVDTVVAFAACPAGTKLTGGGGDDYTSDGSTFINSPADRTTWMVASTTTDLSAPNLDNVVAYAQCYNPRGAVPGASFPRQAAPGSSAGGDASALPVAKQRIANKIR